MKSKLRALLFLGLLGGISDTQPISGVDAVVSTAGIMIAVVTSLYSFVKFIDTFVTRHNYARNFISSALDIESYTVHAHAVVNKRNKMRCKTLHTCTFQATSPEEVVKKCVQWERQVPGNLVLVIRPTITLFSEDTYNLKRLVLKGRHRELLKEKLENVFEVPVPNSLTYGKRAALWLIVLGFSNWLIEVFAASLKTKGPHIQAPHYAAQGVCSS